MKQDFEIVFERLEVIQEEMEMRRDRAFNIIFSELEKAADVRSQTPQNYVRAGEVSVNV